MMREEKLFSGIYIVGTALAIAFTMVMAVVYYIKLAPVYPEANRARTIYFEGLRVEAENEGMGQTGFSTKAFEEWFQNSENIEYCSPTLLAAGTGKTLGRCHSFVVRGKDDFLEVVRNEVSADFFHIYEYDFLSGRPFTNKEVEDKEEVCVISNALAERLFGKGVDAVGRTVELENGRDNLRVVGVIRGCSQLTPDSYADVLMPYALIEMYTGSPYSGTYSVVATVKDDAHLQALKQELDDVAARTEQAHPEALNNFSFGEGVKKRLVLTRHMETHPMHVLRTENRDGTFDMVTNWQLVNQVVIENLVLTTIGGIIGLVLSWLAIYGLRAEILGMFFDNSTLSSAPIVEGEMLFAPMLFIGAFAAIMVLSLLAAVVPAWWSLRKPIVESMMEKR